MTFCIQGPIPSGIFNFLFITIPAHPSLISVKQEVIVPLTPRTSWGSLPSDLVPGWWVLPSFLFGHQAHFPHPETSRSQLSSPTPVLAGMLSLRHLPAFAGYLNLEKRRMQSDRGAKRTTGQKHVCTWGASIVGHDPDFFFTFLTENEETQIWATFFLGTVWTRDTWLLLHREPGSCLALWADSQLRPSLLGPQSWTLGKEYHGANSFSICRKTG